MDTAYLEARITAVKAMIAAYETAITAISTDGIEEYLLDTGQTRQRVKKSDLSKLTEKYESLLRLLCALEARLNGSQVIVRPAW